jgi:hypothetical protein
MLLLQQEGLPEGRMPREDKKWERNNKLPSLALTASTNHEDSDSIAWVLDSGATQHTTGNRDILFKVTALLEEEVYVGRMETTSW